MRRRPIDPQTGERVPMPAIHLFGGRSRRAFYLDLVERTGWTAVQAGAASLIVLGLDLDSLKVAAAGGLLAALKAIAAERLPWTADGSASTLPAEVDPPVESAAGDT